MASLVQSISDFINDGPFLWVFLFMFTGVSLRAQVTYFIGRYMNRFVMTRGEPNDGWQLNAYRWIHSEGTQRGINIVRRRGWPAVPLAFLTVGLQTAIILGAGIIGMVWPVFTLAMIPGTLAWAAIYSTIGWAVWEATVLAALGSPIGIAILIGVGILIAVLIMRSRKTRERITSRPKSSELNGVEISADNGVHDVTRLVS